MGIFDRQLMEKISLDEGQKAGKAVDVHVHVIEAIFRRRPQPNEMLGKAALILAPTIRRD